MVKHLKEGASAGYNITLKNLRIKKGSINITNVNDNLVDFEAEIESGAIGVEAEGYDWGVDEECNIDGGKIKGVSDLNVDKYDIDKGWETHHLDKESVKDEIESDLSSFDVKALFGCGWSHVSVGKEFTLTGYQNDSILEGESNGWTDVMEVTIKSTEICKVIDNAFDSRYDEDEEMFEYIYDESNEGEE